MAYDRDWWRALVNVGMNLVVVTLFRHLSFFPCLLRELHSTWLSLAVHLGSELLPLYIS